MLAKFDLETWTGTVELVESQKTHRVLCVLERKRSIRVGKIRRVRFTMEIWTSGLNGGARKLGYVDTDGLAHDSYSEQAASKSILFDVPPATGS